MTSREASPCISTAPAQATPTLPAPITATSATELSPWGRRFLFQPRDRFEQLVREGVRTVAVATIGRIRRAERSEDRLNDHVAGDLEELAHCGRIVSKEAVVVVRGLRAMWQTVRGREGDRVLAARVRAEAARAAEAEGGAGRQAAKLALGERSVGAEHDHDRPALVGLVGARLARAARNRPLAGGLARRLDRPNQQMAVAPRPVVRYHEAAQNVVAEPP